MIPVVPGILPAQACRAATHARRSEMLRAGCRAVLCAASRSSLVWSAQSGPLLRPVAAGALQPARTLIATSCPLLQQAAKGHPQGAFWGEASRALPGALLLVRTLKGKTGKHGRGRAKAQPLKMKFMTKIRRRGHYYKPKTNGGAKDRFILLGDGRWVHKAIGKSHLQAGSSRRRQTSRKLKRVVVTCTGVIKRLRLLMPYSKLRRLRHYPIPRRELPLDTAPLEYRSRVPWKLQWTPGEQRRIPTNNPAKLAPKPGNAGKLHHIPDRLELARAWDLRSKLGGRTARGSSPPTGVARRPEAAATLSS